MSLLDNLPTTIIIHSSVGTPDGKGGFTYEWPIIATTKCILYKRRQKMKVTDRGIDGEIETKAMFNISDRDNLVNGYKAVADGIEYVIKRPDIIYGRTSPHHMECVMEFFSG